MSGMARSQVDMSLDDIIKLKKEQRENTPKKSQTPNRRNRVRTRVLAARPRLQKNLRLQNKANSPGRGKTQLLHGGRTRPNFKTTTAVSSSAALAVLKRARRTAVEAAKAAAQAAALINQSRFRRREVFDANRNLQSRIQSAGSRNSIRNNQANFPSTRSRVRNRNFDARTSRVDVRQFRLARQRPRRAANAVALRFQRGQPVRFNQTANSATSFNNNRRHRPQNNPTSRQRGRGYYAHYVDETNTSADRAREREYLAQARALIRAQSEQSRQVYDGAQNTFGQYSGPAHNRRGGRGRGRGYRPQY
ncbi:hypothetical protein D915_009062 [Fasciola hepatica]|uniref:Uncharacterized protein n=1 Tax=Fasciola hepatica TaxID=6192 RepID=A0A4E0R029_FASHE|nr:hypothetical protein D915_009062 [Fasciola hepatica]